jgi:hypothetical protein
MEWVMSVVNLMKMRHWSWYLEVLPELAAMPVVPLEVSVLEPLKEWVPP